MKKNMKKLLLLLLLSFTAISCSVADISEEIVETQSVSKPYQAPKMSKFLPSNLRPAIRNVAEESNLSIKEFTYTGKKKTGKSSTDKRVKRSLTYTKMGGSGFEMSTYILVDSLRFDLVKYSNLPNDNLYDQSEAALNVNSEVSKIKEYVYDSNNRLSKIITTELGKPNDTLSYRYDVEGKLDKVISNNTNFIYKGKLISDIIRKKDSIVSTESFVYDSEERMIESHLVNKKNDSIINTLDMNYVYSYSDGKNYVKVFINDSVLGTSSSPDIPYDANKPGVYNNEPYYKTRFSSDNSLYTIPCLHYTGNEKYFYDSEGYLIKYDSKGGNQSVEVFEYEYPN